MFKKIFSLIFLFCLLFNIALSKEKVFILAIIEDKIITNHDVLKESDYLKILNPNLEQLDKQQIRKIAKNSLINEIVKKNEIEKVLDFSKENTYLKEYIKNFYTKLNFQNEVEFENFLLKSSTYTLNEIKEKIKIEVMWNELIFLKYNDQVTINKEKLNERINELNDQIRREFKLSEIVFKKNKNVNLNVEIEKIKSSISEIGFNNTANIYSISESAKLGGDIGWINENNLSKKIFNNIKNLKKDEVSEVIQIGNNYLILKINEIRQINIPINKNEELNKMISFETNKQLNQFSKIFFDKAKINYSINEK
tara:strand:+ start:1263 stop:2192 length:930 start_codon:yes stop_codon:yes gene_type:complete